MTKFTTPPGGRLLRAALLLSLTMAYHVGSAQILSYTSATDGSLNSVAANTTGTAVVRVNGDNAPGSPCSTGFSSTNFTSATTFSTSLAANEVTVTPNSGYSLSVTGFSADMRRSASGPASVRYAYSTDGGTTWTDQGSNQAPNNASCGTTTTGTWTTSFNTTGALKFRIYGFNASSTAGTFQVLNLTINGTVAVSCATPGGVSATGITSSGATLNWTAVSGASGYNIQYRPTGGSTWTSTSSSSASKSISGLASSTTYEFQVQTVCSGPTSGWSSSTDFTTLSGGGGSGTILSFTTATDGSLSSVDPNATGTALARVNGANAPGSPCSTGLTNKNFSSATTYSSSLAAVEVTMTPNSGYTLNVTGFSADMRRSATGPASIRYAYSTDGGTTWTDQGSDQAPDNAGCGVTTTGTWTTSFSTANTLKFRLYGFNASSTAGVLQVLNLAISGSVTSGGGGGGATLNPKFTIYFNNPVDTTVSTGVRAKYLNHCLADTLIAYINRAKYTIDIAQYEYDQTSGFSNIATAVNNAYSRGVTIRWIYDSTINNTGLSTLNSAIHTLSSPAASTISPCHKAYNIMHNKFVLIDANSSNPNDAYVWTGSPDWNVTQFNSTFNNVVIIQDSSLAHAYTAQFNVMWGSTTSTPNAGASLWGPCKSNSGRHSFNVNGTTVELYFTPSDSTASHIMTTLQSANTDLYVGMYTFTDNTDAVQMVTEQTGGVTVDCIVDQYSLPYTAYATLDSGLGSSHLKVYSGGYIYHNKYAIVDPSNTCSDPMVLTGSHNWTATANTENDENTIIIHDATIANIYYQAFKQDFTTLGGSLSHISVGGGCGTTYRREANPAGVQAVPTEAENINIFPNPTSNSFTITYGVTGTENVTVTVLNMVGRLVATLVNNEAQNEGPHSLSFTPPAPGVYIARITIGNNTYTRKVIKM